MHLVDLLDGAEETWRALRDQQRLPGCSPRLDDRILIEHLRPRRLINVLNEALTNELLSAHEALRQGMVVEHVLDESEVVAEHGNVPSDEGNLLVIEVRRGLILAAPRALNLSVELAQSMLRRHVHVAELIAEVASHFAADLAVLSMPRPHAVLIALDVNAQLVQLLRGVRVVELEGLDSYYLLVLLDYLVDHV